MCPICPIYAHLPPSAPIRPHLPPSAPICPHLPHLPPQTLLAEGCRGSLSEQAMEAFALRKDCDPQTYALGLKEVLHYACAHAHFGCIHTMRKKYR